MAIRAYLAHDFVTDAAISISGPPPYLVHDVRFNLESDGRWYFELPSLVDRIPLWLQKYVEEVSLQEKIASRPNVFEHGTAKGKIDTTNGAGYMLHISGKTLEDVFALYQQARDIRPIIEEPIKVARVVVETPIAPAVKEATQSVKKIEQGSKKPLGQLLKEMHLVTEAEIQEAHRVQREQGGAIGKIFIELGYVTEEDLHFALAAQLGMKTVDLDSMDISSDLIEMIEANVAQTYKVIPIRFENDVLTVAMADPTSPTILDDLHLLMNHQVQGAIASPEAVDRALAKYYGVEDAPFDTVDTVDTARTTLDEIGSKADLCAAAQSTPVRRLITTFFQEALEKDARGISIAFDVRRNEWNVSYRYEDESSELGHVISTHMAFAIIARLKIVSGWDVAEKIETKSEAHVQVRVKGVTRGCIFYFTSTVRGDHVYIWIGTTADVIWDLDSLNETKGISLDNIPDEVIKSISPFIAWKYNILPVEVQGERIVLAARAHTAFTMEEELAKVLDRPVQFKTVNGEKLMQAIAKYYGENPGSDSDATGLLIRK